MTWVYLARVTNTPQSQLFGQGHLWTPWRKSSAMNWQRAALDESEFVARHGQYFMGKLAKPVSKAY